MRLSLAGLLLAGITPAQPITLHEPVRTFSERLQSQCARTVAWAAWDIGKHGYASNKRSLVASLQAWASRNGEAADVVRLHLLDALVRLNARLPAADLLPHLHGITEVPAFILIASDPLQNERTLLDLFTAEAQPEPRMRSLVWWGAGNLLCNQKAPGFAAALLDRLEFELMITVSRPGDRLGVGCGGCRCAGSGSETHQRLPGFPPVPVYRFSIDEREKPFCIAPGQCLLGWTRAVSIGSYEGGTSQHNFDDRLLPTWLDQLVGPELGQARLYRHVHYTTGAAWLAAVQTARRDFIEHQRKLIAALVAGKALTRDEAARRVASTRFQIYDAREDQTEPLPAVPDEPATSGNGPGTASRR